MANLTNHIENIFLSIAKALEDDEELYNHLSGGKVKFKPKDFLQAPERGRAVVLLSVSDTGSFEEIDLSDTSKLRCCIYNGKGIDQSNVTDYQLAVTEFLITGVHHIDCNSTSIESWISSLTYFENMVTSALRSVEKLGSPASVTDWDINSIERFEANEEQQAFRGCAVFEVSISVEHIFERPDARCI